MLSQVLLVVTASLSLCNTHLTSPPQTLLPRDAVTDCQNVTLGLNASCWDLIPRNNGMESWLSSWNRTTTTCEPGERWANCFMREANVTSNSTTGIRCDLIGDDVCPEPTDDVAELDSAEVVYGTVSIWSLQQYMTTLYQYVIGSDGSSVVTDEFNAQKPPVSARIILFNILNEIGHPLNATATPLDESGHSLNETGDPLNDTGETSNETGDALYEPGDPVATQLRILLTTDVILGKGNFVIQNETQAPRIVGEAVGSLLQYIMTDWLGGAFTGVSVEGNLISYVTG